MWEILRYLIKVIMFKKRKVDNLKDMKKLEIIELHDKYTHIESEKGIIADPQVSGLVPKYMKGSFTTKEDMLSF